MELIAGVGIAATATALYTLLKEPPPLINPIDLNNQTIIVDEKEGIRCSALCKDRKLLNLSEEKGIYTLYDCIKKGLETSGDDPLLGNRKDDKSPYTWQTYKEVMTMTHWMGSALITQLNFPTKGILGIYATNSTEWVISELTCSTYSFVSVPIYHTFADKQIVYVIQETEMKVIVVDTDNRLRVLLDNMDKTPSLQSVIVTSPITEGAKALAKGRVTLFQWTDFLKEGQRNLVAINPATKDDLSTICYTSGTTGFPKGVLLTNFNFIQIMLGNANQIFTIESMKITKNDVHISYLPLAHILERLVMYSIVMIGGQYGFFRGDIRGLMSDIAELKPTVLLSVPRILNGLHAKVMSSVKDSYLKSTLLNWGIQSKTAEIKRGVFRRNSIYDYLIFNKIQNALGGRIRLIITGAAPISPDVMNFIRVVMGIVVLEGYGQTETSGGTSLSLPGDCHSGHVGVPLPCNYIKLVDVPEMGIVASRDNRGEICVKGYSCTSEYYKQPEQTKDLIDTDGWLHSGDIGLWNPNGTLSIVDRRKNFFKLSQGEFITPEVLEGVYMKCHHISQIFVYGRPLESFLVAIVVPDMENLLSIARKMGWRDLQPEALCRNPKVKEMILSEMNSSGEKNKFKGYEKVKDIFLCSEPFSIENNLLTPTMKSKRYELSKFFKSELKALYANKK